VVVNPRAAHSHANANAWPRGFAWLIGAQFMSALANNALLIVAIAVQGFNEIASVWAMLTLYAAAQASGLVHDVVARPGRGRRAAGAAVALPEQGYDGCQRELARAAVNAAG
jgi:hypothetical protein